VASPLIPEPDGNPGIDVVFPVLHGTFGEDGTIQGLLELAALPYVGAGVLGSALAMDKAMSKRVFRDAGLPVVDHAVLTRGQFDVDCFVSPFPYPVFVKPANLGSSVGISKAHDHAQLRQALITAAEFDRKIIVERAVIGREFECAVLGGSAPAASVPCEIVPSQDFYNYEDKYLLDKAHIDLPAKLDNAKTEEMQQLAIRAFETAGSDGMARVDFLMDGGSGELFVNEINTIPGFTSISMYPKMWEYSGIPYSELLDRLIQLALERAEQQRRTRFLL
jgi:D-alanine-D-alanine ligase